MDLNRIIKEFRNNKSVFEALFSETSESVFTWKQSPEKWSLLEILCHLYDEEREDFRSRLKHTLETPTLPTAPIDPEGWVSERKYAEQDYWVMLEKFLTERTQSIQWLDSLENPNWDNTYQHPELGGITAKMFLSNWLAHDYLHIRQILKLKYAYLEQETQVNLSYAGPW